MTDCEIILDILSDKQWHHVLEIMERGKGDEVKNWAVRSRIADLGKSGYVIEGRRSAAGYKVNGKTVGIGMWEYRLISVPEAPKKAEKPKPAPVKYFEDKAGQEYFPAIVTPQFERGN